MQPSESKIALLIDADNAPASKIDAILSEIAKYGVANIRKAYGKKKTPLPFVYACSTFLYLETIDQASDPESPKLAESIKKTGQELKQDSKLMNLLRGAVSSAQDDDGWSSLAVVGSHIANQASFDPRNYGYAKLSEIFEAIDLFEIQRKNQVVRVRSKSRNDA